MGAVEVERSIISIFAESLGCGEDRFSRCGRITKMHIWGRSFLGATMAALPLTLWGSPPHEIGKGHSVPALRTLCEHRNLGRSTNFRYQPKSWRLFIMELRITRRWMPRLHHNGMSGSTPAKGTYSRWVRAFRLKSVIQFSIQCPCFGHSWATRQETNRLRTNKMGHS